MSFLNQTWVCLRMRCFSISPFLGLFFMKSKNEKGASVSACGAQRKKIFRAGAGLLVFALVFCVMAPSDAAARTRRSRQAPVSTVSARYADIVIDAKTGRILHEVNADQIRHPASLTKMMTLYITFRAIEEGRLTREQMLRVSANAANQSPTKLGLRAGQTVRVSDAVLGLITESANDAAVVLAEAIGGTTENFAQIMTQQARALGMRNTVFRNPSGLPDDEQVTTAREMAMLGYALIYHFPRFYGNFSRNSFLFKGRRHNNHNNLMKRYDGMDGIKTGYIRASGFNLVASAARGDTRLIGVVFGGKSAPLRDKQMEDLLDEGFATPASMRAQDGRYLPLPRRAKGGRIEQTVPAVEADASEESDDSRQTWGVQIGAYNEAGQGQQVLEILQQKLAPLLGNAVPMLQKVTMVDGATVYRARFMGVKQETARAICSYIIKHGQGCLVVPPDPTAQPQQQASLGAAGSLGVIRQTDRE